MHLGCGCEVKGRRCAGGGEGEVLVVKVIVDGMETLWLRGQG